MFKKNRKIQEKKTSRGVSYRMAMYNSVRTQQLEFNTSILSHLHHLGRAELLTNPLRTHHLKRRTLSQPVPHHLHSTLCLLPASPPSTTFHPSNETLLNPSQRGTDLSPCLLKPSQTLWNPAFATPQAPASQPAPPLLKPPTDHKKPPPAK